MTIRDLGYKRYEGELLPHRSRYRVLVSRTLRLFWGSGLVKTTMILGLFPMVVCGVVLFFKVKAIQNLTAMGAPIELEDPGNWVFYCIYWCQIWFGFAMSLLVAAPAIAEDVRTGACHFFFARPVSKSHYLLGKLLPVAILQVIVCGAPGVLLALLRLGLVSSGSEALEQVPLLLRTLVYIPLFCAALAMPPVALSALSRRSGTVQGVWAAAFFLFWVLGEGMAAATGVPELVLLSLPTDLRLVGQHLFGMEPSYATGWVWPLVVILGVIAAGFWTVLHRLEKVEVFT